MTGTTICILITIICYLIMMISIGAFFSKKNKSSDDFYLGGRHLGPLVAAMSAEGTSRIDHIDQIDRGYEDIEHRLNAIGAHVTREE